MCGRQYVDNCQYMTMHFLFAKYLQKDANMTSASHISERWRFANAQHSCSACSTVSAIRDIMPEDMTDCIDDEIMEKLYNEDDALSDFL
jgi:hypothetical protein